jgi:hypothetical protein
MQLATPNNLVRGLFGTRFYVFHESVGADNQQVGSYDKEF